MRDSVDLLTSREKYRTGPLGNLKITDHRKAGTQSAMALEKIEDNNEPDVSLQFEFPDWNS